MKKTVTLDQCSLDLGHRYPYNYEILALALNFASVLRSWFVGDEPLKPCDYQERLSDWSEMINRNIESLSWVCESHDYFDSNQAMLDAEEITFRDELLIFDKKTMDKTEQDRISNWKCTIRDQAWCFAKLSHFDVANIYLSVKKAIAYMDEGGTALEPMWIETFENE